MNSNNEITWMKKLQGWFRFKREAVSKKLGFLRSKKSAA
jgi:hypothetical protein